MIWFRSERFDSKRELERYCDLLLMEKAGVIRDLRRQVRYPIQVNGQHITTWVADFVYWDNEKDLEVVEDSKGFRTRVYKLKKKLVKALYGIDIEET